MFSTTSGSDSVPDRSWLKRHLPNIDDVRKETRLTAALDADRVLLNLNEDGLVAWHVDSGEVQALTKVRPALQPDSWWTLTVALDLVA